MSEPLSLELPLWTLFRPRSACVGVVRGLDIGSRLQLNQSTGGELVTVRAEIGALPSTAARATDSCTVRVDGVSVDRGGKRILDDLSLHAGAGEWIGITGPSGAGKTTLLRVVNGLCPAASGRIRVLGTVLPGRSRAQARAVRRRTGTVLQEVALWETKSARGNVELALRAAGYERRSARRRAVEWLERLGLGDLIDAYPVTLSGGERQRVALARALAPRPDLLILDEPTSALDRATASVALDAMSELVDAGTTILMSSHRDLELAGRCHRRLAFHDGRVLDLKEEPWR
jgi:ABC-type methionine transport system ATPase subunit